MFSWRVAALGYCPTICVYVSLICQFVHESRSFLEPRDGSVGLHGGDQDVEDPEEDKNGGGDSLE